MNASFFISPRDLYNQNGGASAPMIIDVRRKDIYESATDLIPGALWRDPDKMATWIGELPRDASYAIVCKAGHQLSQMVAASLREAGVSAQVVSGGYEGWRENRLPLLNRAELERCVPNRPSLWVTRRRPKIDRVACPWLIMRFLDPQARILFVDPPEVPLVAQETGAIPFDIDGVELSHVGDQCSFDTMLRLFGLDADPALARLALIVRGADTARPDLAPEASGLLAVSLGLSALAGDDDHALLARGYIVYDALFAWARFAADERHNWPAKAS